jgi:hypothetical protein
MNISKQLNKIYDVIITIRENYFTNYKYSEPVDKKIFFNEPFGAHTKINNNYLYLDIIHSCTINILFISGIILDFAHPGVIINDTTKLERIRLEIENILANITVSNNNDVLILTSIYKSFLKNYKYIGEIIPFKIQEFRGTSYKYNRLPDTIPDLTSDEIILSNNTFYNKNYTLFYINNNNNKTDKNCTNYHTLKWNQFGEILKPIVFGLLKKHINTKNIHNHESVFIKNYLEINNLETIEQMFDNNTFNIFLETELSETHKYNFYNSINDMYNNFSYLELIIPRYNSFFRKYIDFKINIFNYDNPINTIECIQSFNNLNFGYIQQNDLIISYNYNNSLANKFREIYNTYYKSTGATNYNIEQLFLINYNVPIKTVSNNITNVFSYNYYNNYDDLFFDKSNHEIYFELINDKYLLELFQNFTNDTSSSILTNNKIKSRQNE